jgi:hypothetical protein
MNRRKEKSLADPKPGVSKRFFRVFLAEGVNHTPSTTGIPKNEVNRI